MPASGDYIDAFCGTPTIRVQQALINPRKSSRDNISQSR